MKKEKSLLIELFSLILAIALVIPLVSTDKSSKLSSYGINLLDISTSDIKEAIDNLKASNATKVEEVEALKKRVRNLSSGTIGTAEGLDKVYPVGSIFISTTISSATEVHDKLGGTWEAYGEGRVLRGTTSGAGTTHNSTGTVTLGTTNLPSHTHTMAHTHKFTPQGTNSYTTKDVATGNQSADHTHTLAARTATSSPAGNHIHYANNDLYLLYHTTNSPEVASGGLCLTGYNLWAGMDLKLRGDYTSSSAGAHTHSVSLAATTTGPNSANHTHTFTSANLKTAIGTIKFTGKAGTTGASSPANTSATGQSSPTAFSTVDAYITVFMYKRTA